MKLFLIRNLCAWLLLGIRVPLVLAAGFSLSAQPSLTRVWEKHDTLVLGSKGEPLLATTPHSHTFTGRSGRKVRAWDLGPSTAPVILTWGGGPGYTLSPDQITDSYAHPNRYRHIVIDQPGTGGSEWAPGWRPEDTIEDAVTFLDSRCIRGPILVNGWSWGSTMALLFAQRHPERVRGMVIGGVWMNTPAEVAYYLDAEGPRTWMPGVSDVFRPYSNGRGTACDLHRAIRDGRGGTALANAYVDAEVLQCQAGQIPRPTLLKPLVVADRGPVNMAVETDENVKAAFIETEMLCRGQRGAWKLGLRFPRTLATIPLVVIQGRYDQVCMPETALRVFRAWPGRRKVFVPMNSGHWNFTGPSDQSRKRAELLLAPEQEQQLKRAMQLDYGSVRIVEAANACLLEDDTPRPAQSQPLDGTR